MKNFFGNKLIVVGFVLFLLFLALLFVIIKIGGAYKGGLNVFPENNNQATSIKINKLKKITLKDSNQNCIEVTPDGAVRVYKDCGKELENAGRTDQSGISKLMKLLSEKDFSKYLTRKNVSDYELTIETEDGTTTIYLPNNPGGGGAEIIDIIEDIEDTLNSPSPYATLVPTPNPSGYVYPTIVPSGINYFSPYPTPSDTTTTIKPFLCDFTETGGVKKPLNVSNIICTTDPSPAPL